MKKLFVFLLLTGILSFIPSSLIAQIPSDGLVAWYPFNGNANDESGNGNNGTVNGATLTTDRFGNANGAYSFDGGSHINILSSNLIGTGSVTISGFFYSTLLANNDAEGCRALVSKWWQNPSNCNADYNAFHSVLVKPTFSANCVLGCATSFYGGVDFSSAQAIQANQWYHFAFEHDQVSGAKLYINGQLINENNISGYICNSTNPLRLGVDTNQGSLWRFFYGIIDDVAIYNRALSYSEIQQLYLDQTGQVQQPLTCDITAATTTLCAGESVNLSISATGDAGSSTQLPTNLQQGLVAYYPFNGNANDESGNGNDGVVNGAALTSDRFGNVNGAYKFISNNDRVEVNLTPINSDFKTISCWFRYFTPSVNDYPHIYTQGIDWADPNIDEIHILGLTYEQWSQGYLIYGRDCGISTTETYADENWHHIIYSVDYLVDSSYLFVDGQMKLARNTNGFDRQISTFTIGNGNSDVINTNGGWNFFFNGEIDEFYLFNRLLSPSEIQQLYTAQSYAWNTGATTNSITVTPTTNTTYSCTVTQGSQTCTASVDITVNPHVTNAISATIIEGETYTLGTQTLTTAGTYTETFTSTTGCDSTVMLTLAVEPALTCNITAPVTSICEGESVTLSVNTTGGASASSQLPANLQQGLVAYYPFNGDANDESGNGNDGVVNGATLTSDRFGTANSAFNFNGSNFISSAISGLPSGNNPRTISIWYNQTNFSNSDNEAASIFHYGPIVQNERFCVLLAPVVPVIIGEGNDASFSSSNIQGAAPSENMGLWTHLVVRFDGNSVSCFLNGVFSFSAIKNYSTQITDFVIGKAVDYHHQGEYYIGNIDDVTIYNRALSPAEIQQLYTAQSFAWNTGATSSSITVTPTTNTTYSCTVTQGSQTCTASVDITVNPDVTNAISATIVEGETYTLGAQTLTAAGNYTEVFSSATGCDSTVTLTLAVLDYCNVTASSQVLCQGQSTDLNFETSIPTTNQVILNYGFDDNNLSGFSPSPQFVHFDNKRLGPMSNTNVQWTRTNLPNHDSLTIEFDLLIISSWDGNANPDKWGWKIDGSNQILTTFSAWYNSNQSFPGSYPSNYPSTSGYSYGIGPIGSVGFNTYAYKFIKKIPHNQNSINLDWYALGLEAIDNESWALDNVKITLHNANAYQVAWSNNINQDVIVNSSNPPAAAVSPSETTTYYATVTTASQFCTDSITITVNPLLDWYADNDGDGFGDSGNAQEACDQPLGFVSNANDCNDAEALAFTGAVDLCDNGIDEDCSGTDSTCIVLGCTDITACNFNPTANADDLSCTYPSQAYLTCDGVCINDTDGDGVCDEIEVDGCTDNTAFNYNPQATNDDGSCEAVLNCDITAPKTTLCVGESVDVFMTSVGGAVNSYISDYNTESDELIFDQFIPYTSSNNAQISYLEPGEYYIQVSGTWCGGSCWNGPREDAAYDFYNGNVVPINYAFTINEYCPQGINGCAHPRPVPDLYNSNHIYYYPYTSLGGPLTIYNVADECCWWDNQGGLNFKLYRRSNYSSINWSTGATTPSITVNPTETTTYTATVTTATQTCTDSITITVNPLLDWYADNDGDGFGDSGNAQEACDQPLGFVSNANDCNDAEALAFIGAVDLCDNGIDEDCSGTDSTCIVLGCTDITACNFNPTANADDLSCTYASQTYLTCDGSCINDTDGDGVCDEVEVAGCTDNTAFNYNPQATNDDGSCEAVLNCEVTSNILELCSGESAVVNFDVQGSPVQITQTLNGCLYDTPFSIGGFIGSYNNKLYSVTNNVNYIVVVETDPLNGYAKIRLDSIQFSHSSWERPQLVDGVIYFAGGWASNFINQDNSCQVTNQLRAYNIQTQNWSNLASMPTSRGAHCTATDGQYFYVFGGLNCTSFKNNAERYNPLTNTWTVLPNMPRARERAGAVYLNGKIYVLGGNTTYGYGFLNAVDVLDLTTLTWSTVASLPLAQDCESGPVAYNGEIYLRGGRYQNCCSSPKVWKYSPSANAWTEFCGGQSFGVSLGVYNQTLFFMNQQTRFLNQSGIFPGTGNLDISWSTGATTPTITISPTETTTYTATVTTATQTCTDSITITVNPLLDWYADADGDGFGDANNVVQDCNQPAGFVADNTDCNDDDAQANPSAEEICDNNRDDNCDGQVDENCTVLGCTDPSACNFDPLANTDDNSCILLQPEICDGLDNNCNNQIDEGLAPTSVNAVAFTTSIYPVCVGNNIRSANLNNGVNSPIIEGNGNDLWYSFTAQYNTFRAGLSAATGDNDIRLFAISAGGCLTLLETEHEATTGNQTLLTDQLIVGQNYYVAVHNISGPMNASAKMCFSHLTASTCDHYYSNNTGIYTSVCNSFKAQYRANALAYAFDVMSATQNNVNLNIVPWTYTTTSSNSVVARLGTIIPANQGSAPTVYTLQIPVLYSLPDGAGNLENLTAQATSTCTLTLNAEPTIALRSTDRCPNNKSITGTIAPDRTVCGAMRYDWEFTEVLPTPGAAQVIQGGAYASVFFLSNVPGVATGKTYNVRVRPVHTSGITGNWGAAHCMRIGAAGMVMQSENQNESDARMESRVPSISIYPNPTATGSFVLQYNGNRRGELTFAPDTTTEPTSAQELVMTDITGKIVFKTNVVLNGNMAEIHFGDLESGLYLIDFGGERSRVQVMK